MKGLLITAAVTILILVGGIFLLSKNSNNPNPVSVNQDVLVSSDSHQTNPGAGVTIVEFGDYRCPACKAVFPDTKKIVSDYGDKINFVFRNYAFLPDPSTGILGASNLASNAAECAADQGKFWEMHDYLYGNQPDESDIKMYTVDNLTKVAGGLGMDASKFQTCLSNKTDDARVKKDFADGQLAQVTGTPTFFINGRKLPGVPSYQDLKSAIDSLLNK